MSHVKPCVCGVRGRAEGGCVGRAASEHGRAVRQSARLTCVITSLERKRMLRGPRSQFFLIWFSNGRFRARRAGRSGRRRHSIVVIPIRDPIGSASDPGAGLRRLPALPAVVPHCGDQRRPFFWQRAAQKNYTHVRTGWCHTVASSPTATPVTTPDTAHYVFLALLRGPPPGMLTLQRPPPQQERRLRPPPCSPPQRVG